MGVGALLIQSKLKSLLLVLQHKLAYNFVAYVFFLSELIGIFKLFDDFPGGRENE